MVSSQPFEAEEIRANGIHCRSIEQTGSPSISIAFTFRSRRALGCASRERPCVGRLGGIKKRVGAALVVASHST